MKMEIQRIPLPFYSTGALNMWMGLIHWLNGTSEVLLLPYSMANSRFKNSITCGCGVDGQVVLSGSFKFSYDEKMDVFFPHEGAMGMHKPIRLGDMWKLWDKAIAGIGGLKYYGSLPQRGETVSEHDIEVLLNDPYDMSAYSKEFIGSPYDPLKAESIRSLFSSAEKEMRKVYFEKTFGICKLNGNISLISGALMKARNPYVRKVDELTGRYMKDFIDGGCYEDDFALQLYNM